MMTHRAHKFEVLWLLILLTLIAPKLQATTLRDNGEQTGDKRGHGPSGAPNDYGPAIKITSSILQLSKATEGSTALGNLGLEHHETTLEQPWPVTTGYQLPSAQTVWLEFPANHQPDFHLIAVPDIVSNHQDHFPASHAGGSDVSSVSDGGRSTLSTGLHTQIISSGTGVTHVSDNLDFGDVVAEKAKGNRRTSYGR